MDQVPPNTLGKANLFRTLTVAGIHDERLGSALQLTHNLTRKQTFCRNASIATVTAHRLWSNTQYCPSTTSRRPSRHYGKARNGGAQSS
jgi:hypothetical protein